MTKLTDLTNQAFDIAKEFTLWGNLLKSDVLLYKPLIRPIQGDIPNYKPVSRIPFEPCVMELYSMNKLMDVGFPQSVSGGNPKTDKFLSKYI
jgi:hypothetical protein